MLSFYFTHECISINFRSNRVLLHLTPPERLQGKISGLNRTVKHPYDFLMIIFCNFIIRGKYLQGPREKEK